MPKYRLVFGGGDWESMANGLEALRGIGPGVLGEAYFRIGDGATVIETEDITPEKAKALGAGAAERYPAVFRGMERIKG